MKLYIYDHCPYCVKARMIFGYTQTPLELVTLLNDDEETPISLIGQKMLPILIKEDPAEAMPESLDIISYINDKASKPALTKGAADWEEDEKLSAWINKNKPIIYALAMPRWIHAGLEEFKTASAVDYFSKKKEAYIGPFKEHLEKTSQYLESIKSELIELAKLMDKGSSFYKKDLSINDFHLFAALRSLSIVKNVEYPDHVKAYMVRQSKLSNVPLHWDIALDQNR